MSDPSLTPQKESLPPILIRPPRGSETSRLSGLRTVRTEDEHGLYRKFCYPGTKQQHSVLTVAMTFLATYLSALTPTVSAASGRSVFGRYSEW